LGLLCTTIKLIVKLKYELFGSLTPRSQEKMKESEAKPRGNPISLETLLGIDRRWAEGGGNNRFKVPLAKTKEILH